MKRNDGRILTTHPGRLPNPDNHAQVHEARDAGDVARFEALVKPGIAEMVRKQRDLGVDIMSDGEFWKARDQKYYDSRVTGISSVALKEGEPVSMSAGQRERFMPEFKAYWELWSLTGNTPRPGVFNPPVTHKYVMTSEVKSAGSEAINREIALVKAGIAAAGESAENFFFPVLGPGWLDHFVWNGHYKTEEEYCYALAEITKADFKAVVDAGFTLQIDDPGLLDSWGMMNPAISIEEYRKREAMRIEATNWALEGIDPEQVRYHTCWGSWHTPHTTDLPFEHTIDLMLRVNANAYSVEAADVRHELDYRLWESTKLPDGKVYIPGVIAHKTTTIEPAELVADRLLTYAKMMGRENVIAGVDCGVGGRSYPDIGWAKLGALSEGAALASKALWG